MALPNLIIKLENGGLGRVQQTSDGVAGIIFFVDRTVNEETEGKLLQDEKVYTLNSLRSLTSLGVKEDTKMYQLVRKDVKAFYDKAGDGAELHIMVVPESIVNEGGESEPNSISRLCEGALHTFMSQTRGRVRLLGINYLDMPQALEVQVEKLHEAAENFASQIKPFRAFLPCMEEAGSYSPVSGTYDRVGVVLASDFEFSVDKVVYHSAAIGQLLGVAASLPVHYSLARVKNGAVASQGWLTTGETPEEAESQLQIYHDAGYIFYRYFTGKNGYYFNDDCMAAGSGSSDYSNLYLGRIIDKAIILAYNSYIEEIMDSIEVDDKGHLPQSVCTYFQNLMSRSVYSNMREEISSFEVYVDPQQEILTDGILRINCSIVPKGVLRKIEVYLGFQNPANNN